MSDDVAPLVTATATMAACTLITACLLYDDVHDAEGSLVRAHRVVDESFLNVLEHLP